VAATRGAGPSTHAQHPLPDALQTQDVLSYLVVRRLNHCRHAHYSTKAEPLLQI